jgi:hypothetical protein
MIESVVHVLGIYYKNTNYEKWTQAFGEDINFLLQISSFGYQWLIRGFKKSNTNSRLASRNGGKLIPWGNQYVPASSQAIHKKNAYPIYSFEALVEPIFHMKIEEIAKEKYVCSQFFSLGTRSPKNWAWISRIILQSPVEAPPEFNPSLDFKMKVKKYIEDVLTKESGFYTFQNQEFQGLDQSTIFDKIDRIYDFIWSMNTQLMTHLGCDRWEEIFYNQQISIKMFINFILCPTKTDQTSHQIFYKNLMTPIHGFPASKIESLLVRAFLLKGNLEKSYGCRRSSCSISDDLVITQEDIILTELAFNILGCYYKNQNIEKWELILKTEDRMFNFLTKISSAKYKNTMYKVFHPYKIKSFKSLNLFPWKSQTDMSISKLPVELDVEFQYDSKDKINKLVRELD